jgi:hypothetical protein
VPWEKFLKLLSVLRVDVPMSVHDPHALLLPGVTFVPLLALGCAAPSVSTFCPHHHSSGRDGSPWQRATT